MTSLFIPALNRLFLERFQGKTCRLESYGVFLFQVKTSLPTDQVKDREIRQECRLDNRPSGLLCQLSTVPPKAVEIFLLGEPPKLRHRFHGLPVYYVLIDSGNRLSHLPESI